MGVIYKITNNINGKIYIGQTRIPESKRWQQHVWHADNDSDKDSLLLCKAIKKYGKESFSREIIEECDNNLLNEKEIYWINFYNSTNRDIGYNIATGGDGCSKYTDEEILKIYNQYKSITKASHELKMSRAQMSRRLQALGIETQNEVIVCQYDLDGNFIHEFSSITEASISTNTPKTYIRNEGVYNGFLWLKKENNIQPTFYLQQLSRSNHSLQGILQYDEYGNFIKKYPNAEAASRENNINVSSIKAASTGKQISAGSYLWIREHNGLSITEVLNKFLLSSSCCKIEEVDTNGNIINVFESCNKAEKYYNWGSNSIKPVCDGKRKSTHGKFFRWENPLKRKLLISKECEMNEKEV